MELYLLDNADPTKATKTKLDCTWAQYTSTNYSNWTPSGSISLAAAKGTFYLGWNYKATQDAKYATWQIDNIKVQ